MNYADCEQLVRDRLVAPDETTLTADEIARAFNSVYRQWYKRFSRRTVALHGAQTTGFSQLTNDTGYGRYKTLTNSDIIEVVTAYRIRLSVGYTQAEQTSGMAMLPGEYDEPYSLFCVPIERISQDEMDALYERMNASEYPAAGLPKVAGAPTVYSVVWLQSDALSDGSGAWRLTVYPPVDAQFCCFPMWVRKFPQDASTLGSEALECSDDEAVGLSALTAIRLLANVGKQDDGGLVQALMAEVPQEMQVMALAPKVTDTRAPFSTERPV